MHIRTHMEAHTHIMVPEIGRANVLVSLGCYRRWGSPSKAPQGDDEQVPEVVVLDEEQELHWHGQQVEHKEPHHFQHKQDTHH